MGHTVRRLVGALFSIFVLAACGAGGGAQTTKAAAAESAYCSTTYPVSNPITVTGTANYFYRATNTTVGLTGDPVSRGIAHAEVVVKNSSGSVIQCSKTSATGGINFQIDKTAGSYTITVNSRANNAFLKASVLADPASNSVYSISQNFTLLGSESMPKDAGTFYAYSRVAQSANLEGAAFHILYNLYLANEYIRTTTSNSAFVAEKVRAYWKQGFNPGYYVGVSSGLSFYFPGLRELYILGGLNGNTKTADTDHFDDSVILHEYGHFLEDVYGKSTSPGGSHNGNFIIDPRLAWSEGWANFIQGAIITTVAPGRGIYYMDTVGYSADSTETGESGSYAIRFNLSTSGAGSGYPDLVSNPGEGTFREVSISRTLYKTITTTSVTFNSFWNVFTDAVSGIRSATNAFTNIGLFHRELEPLVPGGSVTAWNNILADERQNKTTVDYADPVTVNAGCAKFPRTLTPVADGTYDSEPRSNLLRANDFYQFYYNGSGGTMLITYTQVTGQNIDLDLYLYNSAYNYQEDYIESMGQATGSVVRKSDRAYPSIETGSESFNMSGVPAGYYLINIKANTFGKNSAQVNGTAQYTLTLGGTALCPAN